MICKDTFITQLKDIVEDKNEELRELEKYIEELHIRIAEYQLLNDPIIH